MGIIGCVDFPGMSYMELYILPESRKDRGWAEVFTNNPLDSAPLGPGNTTGRQNLDQMQEHEWRSGPFLCGQNHQMAVQEWSLFGASSSYDKMKRFAAPGEPVVDKLGIPGTLPQGTL